jgi:integrase
VEPVDGAPCFFTGSITPGGCGLPSTDSLSGFVSAGNRKIQGGKHHVMPCHHALAEALRAYTAAAGIEDDRKGFLFRTSRGHRGVELSAEPMGQPDAWRMIRKRAVAVGIFAPIGNHSFRATGITAYLSNGGALEHAQEMAAHESPRTTKLYDRTKERLTQDEVERIRL